MNGNGVVPDLVADLAAMTPTQRAAFFASFTDEADHALLDQIEADIAEAEQAVAAQRDEVAARHEHESTMARQARWFADPVAFAEQALRWPEGKSLKPHQAEALRRLARRKRHCVRSLHGVGKTTVGALAILWFAVTREYAARNGGGDWKVPTTASVWRQLRDFLWPEVHKWAKCIRWDVVGLDPWRRGRELLDLEIKLDHGHAFAAASDEPAKLEGAHGDQLLYVIDEGKTVPAETYDAAEGAMGGGEGTESYQLVMSTPGVPMGRFYDIQQRKPGTLNWSVQHITLAEGIASGMRSQEWADNLKALWRGTPSVYANRVLGEFAEEAGGLIKLSWIEAANERWHEAVAAGLVGPSDLLGFDVARFGDDQTVVTGVAGDFVGRPVVLPPGDSIDTANAALPYVGLGVRGPLVIIDAEGVGAGVYDQLARHRELPARMVAFVAGAKTTWTDVSGLLKFANQRSAAWWHAKQLLDPNLGATLCLPDDDELTADFVTPTWETTGKESRILVEPKDAQKSRLGRSPDKGDSVVMALWGRYLRAAHALRPAVATNGHRRVGITDGLLEAAL